MRDTLRVLLGAIALLLLGAAFADLRHWHVNGWWDVLNDQVGYISVGRNLAEKGELSSNTIYTATLSQKSSRNYLYMPGHYVALAASFKLAGAGPLQSVLPSLLAFCVAAVCAFLTGRRLYGRRAGFLAAGVFVLLPGSYALAFTAMAELTLTAAVSVAFCVFVHLPQKARPLAGPVLLAFPFIFRETAALLVIPMAALALGGIPLLQRVEWRRWAAAGLLCVLSVGLLAAIHRHPISSGRPKLVAANLFGGGKWDIYHDATVWERVPANPGLIGWGKAMGVSIIGNIQRLPDLLHTRPLGLEPLTLALLFAGIGLSLTLGWRRRDVLALSAGVLGVAAVLMLMGLYNIAGYRGMRNLVFIWPVLAVVTGSWMEGLIAGVRTMGGAAIRRLAMVGGVMAAACLAVGCWGIHQIAANDEFDARMLALAESVGHDPSRVLASTYDIGLNYALLNHPTKWAFLPVNHESLSVLRKRYDLGTMIVPHGLTALSAVRLKRAGFVLDREMKWQGRPISIYKTPPNKTPPPAAE